MSVYVIVVYIVSGCILWLYLVKKYRQKGYIFSTFNINLLLYSYNIFISPIFYHSRDAWDALRVEGVEEYHAYLNKTIIMNCIGLSILVIVMYYFEFHHSFKVKHIENLSYNINTHVIKSMFVFAIIFWGYLVTKYNGGIPLINHKRGFYYNESFSSVYQAVNQIISVLTTFFAVQYAIYRKYLFYTVVGLICMLGTGNRGPALISVMAPMCILYILFLKRNDAENKSRLNRKELRRKTRVILIFLSIICVVGIILVAVRKGAKIDANFVIQEMMYGNTFSDMRDGAFILKAFNKLYKTHFLLGKTYGAALISFVPSRFSGFRQMWTWGRFSTDRLLGWKNHFGLRGGYIMEPYFNFGIPGIIIFPVLQGFILGKLEFFFHKLMIESHSDLKGNIYLVIHLFSTFMTLITYSSSFYNFYTELFLLAIIVIASALLFSDKKMII